MRGTELGTPLCGAEDPALVFDLDKLPILSRAEFESWIVTLAFFIDFSAAQPKGPSEKKNMRIIEAGVAERDALNQMKRFAIQDKMHTD